MIKLSKRLAYIADQVPIGSRIADIGSDHGLLPAALAQQGIINKAVAGELNEGPFHTAREQIQTVGVQSIVEARRGDGLAVLQPLEVDIVIIAGMGGHLISRILEDGKPKLSGVQKLILQPNIGAELVRRWLVSNDWALLREAVLEEDGNTYEILTAERHESPTMYNQELYKERTLCGGLILSQDWLYMFGPHLISQPSEDWFVKWEDEKMKLRIVLEQIERSSTEAAAQKKIEITNKISTIEEVMKCLHKDKQ